MKSALLQGAEYHHWMMRYTVSVKWNDGRCKIEVMDTNRVENLFAKLRQRRMRWLRHIKRVEGPFFEWSGGNKGWHPMVSGKHPETAEGMFHKGIKYLGIWHKIASCGKQ